MQMPGWQVQEDLEKRLRQDAVASEIGVKFSPNYSLEKAFWSGAMWAYENQRVKRNLIIGGKIEKENPEAGPM